MKLQSSKSAPSLNVAVVHHAAAKAFMDINTHRVLFERNTMQRTLHRIYLLNDSVSQIETQS